MDKIDKAGDWIEQWLSLVLKNQRRQPLGLVPKGQCYNCDEQLTGGQLFCDVDCRDDFDKRQRYD